VLFSKQVRGATYTGVELGGESKMKLGIVLVVALALLVPLASATEYAIKGSPSTGSDPTTGAKALCILDTDLSPGGADVPLVPGVPVTCDGTKLAAGTTITRYTLSFDIYLYNGSRSNVTVDFGYVTPSDPAALTPVAGTFTSLGSNKSQVLPEPRQVSKPAPLTPGSIPVPGPSSRGHATGTITVAPPSAVTIPAGSFVAVRVQSDAPNVLLSTTTSTVTLDSASTGTATVPLPELPAVALFGLGAVVVGSVAWVRRQK
jgi:hypothetical protein